MARLPAASSSLLLNLEAVFTLTIAVAMRRGKGTPMNHSRCIRLY
jgi:hypothetical protein